MNATERLLNQQYGLARWDCYDNILRRLRCPREEQYTQLVESEDVVCDTPIFACKFAQEKINEHYLALANEDGKLAVHDTTNREERYGTRAHNNAIFDIAWMFGNMKIVTASGDHTAKLFDVSNSDIREIKTFYGHLRSVKSIVFRRDDPSVFATGGRDGNIIVWDTRTDVNNFIGKADRTIYNSHNTKATPSKSRKKCTCLSPSSASNAKSVTGLVFQDDNTLISCGAGDGVIKVWDLRKNYLFYRHEPLPKVKLPYAGFTTKNGFSSLVLDKNCTKLYANCLDNTIYCYNMGTYSPTPLMKFVGHQNSTFYIKSSLSKDGNYLISGSSDENAYIWNTKHSKPLVKLTGHTAEVTCVAWCEKDEITLVTCSDDVSHKIWRVGPEELPEDWDIIGKGKAEVLPLEDSSDRENLKRVAEDAPTNSKKLVVPCQRCENPSTSGYCQNCCVAKRKPEEYIANEFKRLRADLGPRRLFHDLTESTTSDSDNETKPPLAVNLPNFVLDGIAPHLNHSPPKKKSQDWLTQMRTERKLRQDITEMASTSTLPKVPKLDPMPKRISTQSPIIRFFKVRCDGHSHSKANGPSGVVTSPQSSQ